MKNNCLLKSLLISTILIFSPYVWSAQQFPAYLYVDDEYRAQTAWYSELRSVLAEVKKLYLAEFDIELIWQEPVYWFPDSMSASVFNLLDNLQEETVSLPAGIVMGFTGKQLSGRELGVAHYYTGHVVVKRSSVQKDTIVHELAHIFGAVHVEHEPLIMNAVYSGKNNLSIDRWNKEIILLNKERTFDASAYPISRDNAQKIIPIYTELLDTRKSDNALLINLGSVLSMVGDYTKAVQILREASTYFRMKVNEGGEHKELNEIYLTRARENLSAALCQMKEWQDALFILEDLYQKEPSNRFVQWHLGLASLHADDYSRSKTIFEELEKSLPESVPIALNLGYIYTKLNVFFLAETKLQWVIQKDPLAFEAYYNLGSLYVQQKRVNEALFMLNRAVDLRPNTAELYQKRGVIYHMMDNKEKALENYERALTLDPSLTDAGYNAGIIYLANGTIERAEKLFNQVIASHPDYASAYGGLGTVYLKKNDISKSRTYYEKALKYDDTLAEVYYNLYYVYIKLGLDKKAQKASRRYQKLTGSPISP